MSNIQDWYYRNREGESTGPISSEELQKRVDELVIVKKTYVWTDGLEEWVPASKVGGLFDKQINASVSPATQAPSPTQEASPTRIENPAASIPQPPLMVASAMMIASTPTTAPLQPDQISQPAASVVAAAPIPQLKRPGANTQPQTAQAPLQAQSTQVENPLLAPAMAQQPVNAANPLLTPAATPPPVAAPPAAAHPTQQVQHAIDPQQAAMDPQQAAMMQQQAMLQQQAMMHQQAMLQHQQAMQAMQAQASMMAQQGAVPTQAMMTASAPLLNPASSQPLATPPASSSQALATPILVTPAHQAVTTPQNAATAPLVAQAVAQPQSSATHHTQPAQAPAVAASAPLLTPNAGSQPLVSPPAAPPAQAAQVGLVPVTMVQTDTSPGGPPAPRSVKFKADKPTKRIKLSKETAPVRLPEAILASAASGANQIAAPVPQSAPQAAPVLHVPAFSESPTSSFQNDDNIVDLTEQPAASQQPSTPTNVVTPPALAVEPSKVGTKLLVDPNAVTATNNLVVAGGNVAKPKLNVGAKTARPQFNF